MDKLLASINTRLTYIETHTENAFILNVCRVIRAKMAEIKAKVYKAQATVNDVCDRIVNVDINKMQRVPGEAKMVYTKMVELAGFIEQIKDKYFEDEQSEFDSEDGGQDE